MAAASGATANLPAGLRQCEDFMQFEVALRECRTIDDKIIHALNNSIPTASFRGQVDVSGRCRDIWNDMEATYGAREAAINRCIALTEDKIEKLTASGEKARQPKLTLRMLKSELVVEDVIRERTRKAFYEKCRDHYKPPTKPAS